MQLKWKEISTFCGTVQSLPSLDLRQPKLIRFSTFCEIMVFLRKIQINRDFNILRDHPIFYFFCLHISRGPWYLKTNQIDVAKSSYSKKNPNEQGFQHSGRSSNFWILRSPFIHPEVRDILRKPKLIRISTFCEIILF